MFDFNNNEIKQVIFNNNEVDIVKYNGSAIWAKPMGTLRTFISKNTEVVLTLLAQRTSSYEPTASIGTITTGADGTPVYYGDNISISGGEDGDYEFQYGGELQITEYNQKVYLSIKESYLRMKVFTAYESYTSSTYLYISISSDENGYSSIDIYDQYGKNGGNKLANWSSMVSSSVIKEGIFLIGSTLENGIECEIFFNNRSLGMIQVKSSYSYSGSGNIPDNKIKEWFSQEGESSFKIN